MELQDLPNVGEKTAEKLRDAGFADMMRLATATPKELAVKAEIGEGVAEKVIEAARKAEKIDFETAFDVMERRRDVGHITTGSKGVDEKMARKDTNSRRRTMIRMTLSPSTFWSTSQRGPLLLC